ncbi:MAG: DNA methyltransferase [Gemmataceae bacterium]
MKLLTPDWQTDDGRTRLYRGDCLEVLPKIRGAAAVITDPPYGINYKSKQFDRIANDRLPFIWFLHPAFHAAAENSCLLCFCRWDVQEAFKEAIKWAAWSLKSQIIWDRGVHGAGDTKGCPAPQHDVIWFATKGRFEFHGNRPKSVVMSMKLNSRKLTHPNEKPIELMKQLVESYCPPGQMVVDPFLGSASTADACIQTGRPFAGIELDDHYFDQAIGRVETACNLAGIATRRENRSAKRTSLEI